MPEYSAIYEDAIDRIQSSYASCSLQEQKIDEVWKDIPGYEGHYQVSNIGRVRGVDRYITNVKGVRRKWKGSILKLSYDQDGYHLVGLNKDGCSKSHYVHRLVAQCFLDSWDSNLVVNHKNGIKDDNSVSNLEMVTIKENNQHFWQAECFEKARELYRENHRKASTGPNNPMYGVKRHLSEETRRKMSESHKGKVVPEEVKQKQRQSNLGKKRSKETCNNISIAKRNNMTLEKRQRISEAAKAAWARKKGLIGS